MDEKPQKNSNALAAMTPARRHGPPSVIHASLMRSGTMSMARAYDTLGLRAYHGLDMVHRDFDEPGSMADWAKLERAAQATWPGNSPTTSDFTRKDWDDIFGEFDAITDVGSCFVEQLIEAYPVAKVVLVQRDFEPWWRSYQAEVLGGVFHPIQHILKWTVWPLSKCRSVEAMQKIVLGAFQADNHHQVRQKGRQYYDAYYETVRQKVPADRLLEYRLGQGWEPLCEFLGKPVPDVPFPRVNDAADHQKQVMYTVKKLHYMAFANSKKWIVWGAVVLAHVMILWWMA